MSREAKRHSSSPDIVECLLQNGLSNLTLLVAPTCDSWGQLLCSLRADCSLTRQRRETPEKYQWNYAQVFQDSFHISWVSWAPWNTLNLFWRLSWFITKRCEAMLTAKTGTWKSAIFGTRALECKRLTFDQIPSYSNGSSVEGKCYASLLIWTYIHDYQRKFRNLTSDYTESCCWRSVNQEMWSRRCDIAEMWDMRIWRVGSARNAVFFHSFVASPARKVRS